MFSSFPSGRGARGVDPVKSQVDLPPLHRKGNSKKLKDSDLIQYGKILFLSSNKVGIIKDFNKEILSDDAMIETLSGFMFLMIYVTLTVNYLLTKNMK